MTIDKAIAQEKELFEHCKRLYEPLSDEDKSINPLLKNEIEYHKQLAEWLEELKSYRECNVCEYNKAIDDFVKFASTMPTVEEEDGTIRPMWLEEMAEQLKTGELNEQT